MLSWRHALAVAVAAWAAFAFGETVPLDIGPAEEALLQAAAEGAEPLQVSEDRVLVVGRVDDPRFSVPGIDNITILAPDGTPVPLRIEKPSLFYEFDEIVSLRCAFEARREDIAGVRDFVLKWGADVQAANRLVPAFALDEAAREGVMQFRRRPSASGPPAGSSVATIEVVADSSAEYYFLWYLLPMAVIFIILTLRKILSRHADDSTAS